LDSGSTLKLELSAPGVVGGTSNDLLSVNGAFTLDGTLQVATLPGFGVGTYRIANYTGALTNNTLNLDATFIAAWPGSSINTATSGQVNLIVIPEPNSALLVLGAAGLLAGLRRYRRE
jgi:fibronectin-binding autotransporter adhesin